MAIFIPSPTAFSTAPNLNSQYSSAAQVCGFEMLITGNTTFTLSPGMARALTVDWNISYPAYEPDLPGLITVDTSTVGVNGCYPVLPVPGFALYNTLFPVYAIGDTSGSNQTGAIVATGDNFLPTGYDAFRRIGWVYISSSTAEILPMTQTGYYENRAYQLQNIVGVLEGGTSNTFSTVDLTAIEGMVPTSATDVNLVAVFDPAFVEDQVGFSATGQDAGALLNAPIQLQAPVLQQITQNVIMVPGVYETFGVFHAAVDYIVTNGSLNLSIAGFTDTLKISLV